MTIEKLTTPVGRLVWGHPCKTKVQTDPRTKLPRLGKDGQPVQQCAFGVAYTKAEFQQILWPLLSQEAATLYPHGAPQGFSWKFKDGDTVDRKGIPYSNREGYAGNIVLTVSTTSFIPPVFKFENGAYRQLAENEIKCGDFVRLNLNIKANAPTDPTHTPGLYVNPNGVEFVAYGQEIVNSGGDPDELFGGAPVTQLPPGASAVPLSNAPAGAPMPGMQPMPGYQPQTAPQYTPPVQPMQQQYAQPGGQAQPIYAAQPLPAPAHDFVNNATGQQQYVQQMPGSPQPGFTQQPQHMQSAIPVGNQPGYMPPAQQVPMGQQSGYAQTVSHSNQMPGMPVQR